MKDEFISKEDLEKERTPSELSAWIVEKGKQICSTSEGSKAFRLQEGYIKQLIEELVPLAIFGKHKFGDTDQVFLKPVISNDNYDAVIIDKRAQFTYVSYIEITQAHEGYDNYLRRKQLFEKGIVPSNAPVT